MVRLFIKAGGDINIQDSKGDTPLHKAITNARIEIITLLLEQPGINLRLENNNYLTALDLVNKCDRKEKQEIRSLIKKCTTQKINYKIASKSNGSANNKITMLNIDEIPLEDIFDLIDVIEKKFNQLNLENEEKINTKILLIDSTNKLGSQVCDFLLKNIDLLEEKKSKVTSDLFIQILTEQRLLLNQNLLLNLQILKLDKEKEKINKIYEYMCDPDNFIECDGILEEKILQVSNSRLFERKEIMKKIIEFKDSLVGYYNNFIMSDIIELFQYLDKYIENINKYILNSSKDLFLESRISDKELLIVLDKNEDLNKEIDSLKHILNNNKKCLILNVELIIKMPIWNCMTKIEEIKMKQCVLSIQKEYSMIAEQGYSDKEYQQLAYNPNFPAFSINNAKELQEEESFQFSPSEPSMLL